LLTKWLLGWEIYYGDIPPWRRAMTLSEDDYQDSTATPETRKIWGEDKAKAVRPTVIMTPRSKPEVV
jgi:hypothetical protein